MKLFSSYSGLLRVCALVLIAVAGIGQARQLKHSVDVLAGWGGYRTRFDVAARRLARIAIELPKTGPIAFASEVNFETCEHDRDSLYGFGMIQFLLAPRIVRWAAAEDSILILEKCDTLLMSPRTIHSND